MFLHNGAEYKSYEGEKPVGHGLGYARKAVYVPVNSSVNYEFTTKQDSIWIETSLAPNLPVEGKTIRFGISVDGESEQIVDFKTVGRSEEWKENVLTNQAIRITSHKITNSGNKSTLKITALDEGVIIDQIKIFGEKREKQKR